MFFLLSKTVGFFVVPSNFIFVVGFVGVVLSFTSYARVGWRLLIGCMAAFLLLGCLPLGDVMLKVLESRFPAWDAARGAPDGIIVLGGAIDPDLSAARGEIALNDAAERLTSVAALARQYPLARIVYSGGSGRIFAGGVTEAEYAPRLLESFGVARDRILTEGRSRNTAENATFSQRLVDPKPGERWLLVTSGYHMPRAIGTFRTAGFSVEAYPVDWRTGDVGHTLLTINTLVGGLAATDLAVHEWAGLCAYWLTGRSSELFPGPRQQDP